MGLQERDHARRCRRRKIADIDGSHAPKAVNLFAANAERRKNPDWGFDE